MKTMNHQEYQEVLKTKSIAELLFIIHDAKEAAAANLEGENAGYYLDEINYAAMEIRRRRGN